MASDAPAPERAINDDRFMALSKPRAAALGRDGSPARLSTAEELIEEARQGRMFILIDDEDRENEGDLVMPAQMVTPEKINFMAKFGRGLVCLAISSDCAKRLNLEPMTRSNGTRHQTAFTVSIEARDGVSTGISAADRARTIAVAIDATNGSDAIVTPGHVFPLVARDGGVLVRAGHTEAAVDVARLAGLNPAGVICEIMNDDGTMSRLDDLLVFAEIHRLKIGTIRDLIAYRRKHDRLLEQRAEIAFESRWGGSWKAVTFYNQATEDETIALVKGAVDPGKPTLVRMHAVSYLQDMFGEESSRVDILSRSMEAIAREGCGVIVVITRPAKGLVSRLMQLKASGKAAGSSEIEAFRDYGVGAQVLAELGVEDMILLTNSHHGVVGLEGYGLSIVDRRPV